MFSLNCSGNYRRPLDSHLRTALGDEGRIKVESLLRSCPASVQTELYHLPALARHLGVGKLSVKDESTRLGLGSFKALGGAYAVIRLVIDEASRCLGRTIGPRDLMCVDVRDVAARMTVACATDGNHGKSVAAGAALLGVAANIFVHSGVSPNRCEAITAMGARITCAGGTYDESVSEAIKACEQNGWHMVSDTSWPGYEETPLIVMQGYTMVVYEALLQLPELPTHVFLQAGVGGLAASCAAYLNERLGFDCPTIIIVEPSRANCIYESNLRGEIVKLEGRRSTLMAMLECYEPSLLAWEVLSRLGDAFLTVEEHQAVAALQQFARPMQDDPAIISGESGCVGLAGLQVAMASPTIAKSLGLNDQSRILLVSTEGATDASLYEKYLTHGHVKV